MVTFLFFTVLINMIFQSQTNKILILGKVGFQSDQITAASWSGNTCQPSNQLIITLIRLLFGCHKFSSVHPIGNK